MKKIKTICILLGLMLALQLFAAAAPGAYAAGPVDDSASVAWSVAAKDPETDADLTLTDADEVAAKLGPGFSVDFGKNSAGEPITAPTVADLRANGVKITPPQGYAVNAVYVIASGASAEAGSSSLLKLAAADLGGSGAMSLPAAIFAEGFDASAVGTVFNGSGDTYFVCVALEKLQPDLPVTVTYSAGSFAEFASQTLVSGGNVFTLTPEAGKSAVSCKIASLDAAANDKALREYGRKFVSWTLRLSNGASAAVAAGDTVTLSCPASVEASWKDVIVFAFPDAEKMYDGTPLTVAWTQAGDVKSGDVLSIPDEAVHNSITECSESGESTIDLSLVKVTRDGADVTGEYEFVVLPGKLNIVRISVTACVDDVTAEYSGSPIVPSSYTVTYGAFLDGHTAVPAYSGSQTVPGSSSAVMTLSVRDGEGRDVTSNYNISIANGTLTVTERSVRQAITVTVKDLEKTYDGAAAGEAKYELSSGELLGSDKLVLVSSSGSIVDAGEGSIDAVFAVKNGENDVSSNYDVTVVPGKLTVKPREITLTADSAEKEYDGTALEKPGWTITSGSAADSQTITADVAGSVTVPGSADNKIDKSSVKITDAGGTDRSANYKITLVDGKLTVKPREITLTADSDTKDFDGKALTKPTFTMSSGSTVTGHTVKATVKGSQTQPGSSANVIDPASVKITDASGGNVTKYYSVKLVDGTLTVNGTGEKIALTVTVKSAEKVYDGTPLKAGEYEISSGKLADGDTLELVKISGAERTEVGENSIEAEFVVKNGGADVSIKYSLTVVPGKLNVKAREITVTAASDSKIYDGKPLTRDSWKITSGELAKGHKLSATVKGSQTELGSSANMIVKDSVKIVDADGKDVTKNYIVTTAAGTLTVNKNPVTDISLSVGSHTKVYDGQPMTFSGADIRVTAGGPLPAGYTVEATFNPSGATEVGKYDVTIKSVTIRDARGNDVTSKFNITRVKGSLEITARPLVIETRAANKVYDGTALTERSTPTITGRVDNHQVTLRITGSQTKVGSSENTVADVKITDKTTGADVTKNYSITYKYGLLTVTAADGTTDDAYTWVSGSKGTLYFKFDHSYDGFEGVLVDGKAVDKANYSSASGSTDVWLKASFLNKLDAGKHSITAKYSNGDMVKITFTVKSSGNVRTGDGNFMLLWIIIMVVALIGAGLAIFFLLKGNRKDRKPPQPPKGPQQPPRQPQAGQPPYAARQPSAAERTQAFRQVPPAAPPQQPQQPQQPPRG